MAKFDNILIATDLDGTLYENQNFINSCFDMKNVIFEFIKDDELVKEFCKINELTKEKFDNLIKNL